MDKRKQISADEEIDIKELEEVFSPQDMGDNAVCEDEITQKLMDRLADECNGLFRRGGA